MSMPTQEAPYAVLTDLLAAVTHELDHRNTVEPHWASLVILGLKRLEPSRLFLRLADIDAVLVDGAEVRVRLDGIDFLAAIVGLRSGDFTIRVDDCDVRGVNKADLLLPVYGQLEEVRTFLNLAKSDQGRSITTHPSIPLANALTEPWTKRSLQHEIEYIVGAPGSGKTSILVDRAIAAAQSGDRVVMISFTNSAADVIFERVARKVEAEGFLTVSRHGETEGAIHLENQLKCPRVTVDRAQRESLDANIMITTAYRAFFLARSHQGTHSHVFIDEASTMPLVLAWTSALLATSSVVLSGDPYQLGPIGEENRDVLTRRQSFTTSPFEVEGVMEAAIEDPCFVVLKEQHRLPGRLAAAATPPLYRHTGIGDGISAMEPSSPWGDGSLLYVDTSVWKPIGERVGGSRLNHGHALLVKAAVQGLLEQGVVEAETASSSLIIITPYRAQRRHIRKVLDDTGWFPPAQVRSCVTTIHRAQGTERPYVILEVTDAPTAASPGTPSIGRLWDGKGWQSDGSRLLTTALTRASTQSLVILRRDLAAVTSDPQSPEIKSLPRLNAMLERYGVPAAVAPPPEFFQSTGYAT